MLFHIVKVKDTSFLSLYLWLENDAYNCLSQSAIFRFFNIYLPFPDWSNRCMFDSIQSKKMLWLKLTKADYMFHTRLKQKMEWNALPCAKLFHTNCSKPNFPSPHNFTLLVKYQIIWASLAKWLTLLPQTTSATYRELGVTTTGNTSQASCSWQTSWQEIGRASCRERV